MNHKNNVQFHNIPEELTEYNQWVAWRAAEKNDGKITKIPVNPHTGYNASTKDPDTWSPYDVAVRYYEKHQDDIAGIGFVFTNDDPFCGIDLDDCYDPDLKDWAS